MSGISLRSDPGALFLGIGAVVVVTLVTLPFVGWFFAAALAGGLVIAVLLFRHTHHRL